MNTKLRELSQKATEYCMEKAVNKAWMFEDKFAEHIVLACITVVNKWEPEGFIEQKLKDEFGLNNANT